MMSMMNIQKNIIFHRIAMYKIPSTGVKNTYFSRSSGVDAEVCEADVSGDASEARKFNNNSSCGCECGGGYGCDCKDVYDDAHHHVRRQNNEPHDIPEPTNILMDYCTSDPPKEPWIKKWIYHPDMDRCGVSYHYPSSSVHQESWIDRWTCGSDNNHSVSYHCPYSSVHGESCGCGDQYHQKIIQRHTNMLYIPQHCSLHAQ